MSKAAVPEQSAAAPRGLLKRHGLRRISPDKLSIRRQRRGTGYTYLRADGRAIKDKVVLKRLASLAVPPAYENVRFAEDEAAHIQAIGTDDAGRTQYRYHPEWLKVRESQKADRLLALVKVMPKVRRAIGRSLAEKALTRARVMAAVVDLVACSAIRAGSERYAKQHGTRGATTLLKSNVAVKGKRIVLSFKGKLGKPVEKEVQSRRLAAVIRALRDLPGRRLFQYRDDEGAVRQVRRGDTNEYLREIAGVPISLKDFRTLVASDMALANLAAMEPGTSERRRKKQVKEAVALAADELSNTPAICRKSYVHGSIVEAFENGTVGKFAPKKGSRGTREARELALGEVLEAARAVS